MERFAIRGQEQISWLRYDCYTAIHEKMHGKCAFMKRLFALNTLRLNKFLMKSMTDTCH